MNLHIQRNFHPSPMLKLKTSLYLLSAFMVALFFTFTRPVHAQSIEQVAQQLKQQGFNGAILAAKGDKVLFQKSYEGFGDLQRSFRFASITKQMTAILLMQEVESGRLKLDDSLGQHWPDYPNPDARKITLRQLATHYSGLFNENAIPDFHMSSAQRGDNMQEFAKGICAGKMTNPPGTQFDYNNCDYMVLGALLEKITKKSFAQLLQDRIFKPAGMQNSGLYTAQQSDIASHVHGILNGQPEPAVNFASYGAAGSSYGTLNDLFAFQRAFIKGVYLKDQTRAIMVKPNQVGGAIGVWSYPFTASPESTALTMIERQGFIAGMRINCIFDLQQQYLLIIVAPNADFDMNQTWAGKGPAAALLSALVKTKVSK